MPRCSRRKRWTNDKRTRKRKGAACQSVENNKPVENNKTVENESDQMLRSSTPNPPRSLDFSCDTDGPISPVSIKSKEVSSLPDHAYCSSLKRNGTLSVTEDSAQCNVLNGEENEPSVSVLELLMEVKQKVDFFLPRRWISVVDNELIHVMCCSAQSNKTVQRTLEFSQDGGIELFVHCQSQPIDPFCENLDPFVPLKSDTVNFFVDRIVSIVNNVRKMEVCSGYDELKFEHVWTICPFGKVDENPYRECRYVQTFRSMSCLRLVKNNKWRCCECTKLSAPLKRRANAAAAQPNKYTANKFLNEEQKLKKLAEQHRNIDLLRNKLNRMQESMQHIIKAKGVCVEDSVSSDFSEILSDSAITPAQSIFLQQQIKASQLKNACGMRWHPTMIRLALSFHLTSPAAYELMRQTGMVKLPSSRTLFDYSHSKPIEEGIDKTVLEKLADKVKVLSSEINKNTGKKERHKIYHVLMGDEMHISQNLVFQKSSGSLIGFTTLDTIDREVKILEQHLDDYTKEFEECIASKIMVYMVKGVTNGVKEVIATYAVSCMSAIQMKVWTWKVIGALERGGMAVVAFVCDGSSVNRAFINSHIPATKHSSGVVFDTWNKCCRRRKLFFISDAPHLLKTIRNCFLNSRWDRKKSRRRMVKNHGRISWDYIIKLYEAKRGKTLRKSYKLNAMNVYPDSYARMKVKYAGQVMSNTVYLDLMSQGWPEAIETANFIKKVNDWFDCLNGAHSSVARKTRNHYLAPYESVSDERFNLLDSFIQYLNDWEFEAKHLNTSLCPNSMVDASAILNDPDDSEIDEGGACDEEETPACRKQLSKQTLQGIRITTLAFKPLVQFLLNEGASFINARVFTQDPLEQHFSKMRAGQGGSSNPNLGQALKRNRALELIGEMGMKRPKGNSGECANFVEVTTEKLPKLQSNRKGKFVK